MTCIVIANVARKKTCPKDPFVCSKKGMIYPIQSYDRKGWDIGPSILRILRLDELNKTNLQSDSQFFVLLRRGRWISHRDLHINWKREKTWNNEGVARYVSFSSEFLWLLKASIEFIRANGFRRKFPWRHETVFWRWKMSPSKQRTVSWNNRRVFFRGSRLVWF